MDKELAKAQRLTACDKRLLGKFEAELSRPAKAGYAAYLVFILIIFNIFDQVSTNIFNQFEDVVTLYFARIGSAADVWVNFDVFGNILASGADYDAYQVMNGKLTLGATIGFALMVVAPFYKSLADVYGRKPFFLVNSIGLTVAVLLGFASYYIFEAATTAAVETLAVVTFILAQVIIVFFTIQDIQMLYIFEVIREARRATVFGVTKGLGLFASVLVIASRLLSIDNIAGIQWQYIYLVVAVLGMASFVIAATGLHESEPFMRQRVEYLKLDTEAREKRRIEQNRSKIGVWGGLKTMFKNKQLRMLSLAMLCVSVANNMVCTKANTIMIQSGMSTLYITVALVVAKAIEAALNMVMGWLSDKLGRKPVTVVLAAFNAVAMTLFCFYAAKTADMSGSAWTSDATLGATFVGAMYGIALSSYLCLFDQLNLLISESSPTYLRSSIVGCSSIFRITAVVALILQSVLAITSQTPTAWVCYVLSVPFIIGATVIIMLRVKETKGLTIAQIDAQFDAQTVAAAEDTETEN